MSDGEEVLENKVSYYEGKRSNTLLKVKSFYDGELRGHNDGSSKHKGR